MKFTLEIDMENAAFGPTPSDLRQELQRLLEAVSRSLRYIDSEDEGIIRDLNGNRVGHWGVK